MYHVTIKVDNYWIIKLLAFGENVQEAVNDAVEDINSDTLDFDYSNFTILKVEKVS